jgi:hypothetical protein
MGEISGLVDHGVELSVATCANDIGAVANLVEELTVGARMLEEGSEEARQKLLLNARTLVQSLETPRETMIKHTWAQVSDIFRTNIGCVFFFVY